MGSSLWAQRLRQCVPLTTDAAIIALQAGLLVVFLGLLHSSSPPDLLPGSQLLRSLSLSASGGDAANSESPHQHVSVDCCAKNSGNSSIEDSSNEDNPPPFPPPERAIVAWFARRYWSAMNEAAARCGLKRSRQVAWRDLLAGVSNQDRVTRADYPGIAGAFFDTAFDFRFVRNTPHFSSLHFHHPCFPSSLSPSPISPFLALLFPLLVPPLLVPPLLVPPLLVPPPHPPSPCTSPIFFPSRLRSFPLSPPPPHLYFRARPPFFKHPECRHLRRGCAFSLLRQLPLVHLPPRDVQLPPRDVQLPARKLQLPPKELGREGGGSGVGVEGVAVDPDLKLIAIVFPQFHACRENDEFWGVNFTEWDNVKRAYFHPTTFRPVAHPIGPATPPKPPHTALHSLSSAVPKALPISHPLSHLSGGYYNFLSRSHRRRTSALARAYGFHGLCYHHYWFGCRRTTLAEPLLRMLEDGEPNLPFCLIWANEPWTNRWDGARGGGEGNGTLLGQTYGDEECWREHFDWLLKFFNHPNYIKVSGRPMFGIYQLSGIPEPEARGMFDIWHSLARQHGLPGLHLFQCLTSPKSKPSQRSLVQAVAEYEPNYRKFRFNETPSEVRLLPNHYRGSYVAWDNFPRHSTDLSWRLGDVAEDPIHLTARMEARMRLARQDVAEDRVRFGSSPNGTRTEGLSLGQVRGGSEKVQRGSDKGAVQKGPQEVQEGVANGTYFFVAAWNEWGEGNALEPNHIFGFGNLNAVARAYARSRHPATEPQLVLRRLAEAAVACGLCLDVRYYVDMDGELYEGMEGRVRREGGRIVKHFIEKGFLRGKQFRLRRRRQGKGQGGAEVKGQGEGQGKVNGEQEREADGEDEDDEEGDGEGDGEKGDGKEVWESNAAQLEGYHELSCFSKGTAVNRTAGSSGGGAAAAPAAGTADDDGREGVQKSTAVVGCKWLKLPLDYATVAYLVEEELI
ncbi:unnamed protein product [Closterium sp. Yama58-4]|nr:unnamed protein product [Closterium sp. Yama58-4]